MEVQYELDVDEKIQADAETNSPEEVDETEDDLASP